MTWKDPYPKGGWFWGTLKVMFWIAVVFVGLVVLAFGTCFLSMR